MPRPTWSIRGIMGLVAFAALVFAAYQAMMVRQEPWAVVGFFLLTGSSPMVLLVALVANSLFGRPGRRPPEG